LGVLVDLALARVRGRNADEAVTLLVEAAQLGLQHGIDGFAHWRLREGRAALPRAHQRAFGQHLQALA
jgi:hypothetical protein